MNGVATYNDRIFGAISNAMGPVIRELMADDSVIEILLNPDGQLWVERLGEGMSNTGQKMSKAAAETLIRHVASQAGERCNEESPSLSSILPVSNARFQAMVYPIVDAPAFSIRRRATRIFSLDDYVASGVMTLAQKDFLARAVLERKNILVVGGTGSGKTTLSNALLLEMSRTDDRIITIEDTPELQCYAKNKTQIFTKTEIDFTMKKAVKEVLRMRPDRIVVGEVRDGAALDLLKAWNTGHSGGIATVHANNARLALRRIESLISEVSLNIQRDLIADAIDVVVCIARRANQRVVDEIVEIALGENQDYKFRTVV